VQAVVNLALAGYLFFYELRLMGAALIAQSFCWSRLKPVSINKHD
jgi:hypothetical protein